MDEANGEAAGGAGALGAADEAGSAEVEDGVVDADEGGKRGAVESGLDLNGDPFAAPPNALPNGESDAESEAGWAWGVEGASTIMDPVDEVTFFGGGPDSDLSVVDGTSASGRVALDPQGVAPDGGGGTAATAGEGGAEAGAPKLKDDGDPPKLNGDAAAAAGLGVEDAAPNTGIAGDGFGDENGLAGTDANGLDAAGVEDDPPNVNGAGAEEGVPPKPDDGEGAALPKLKPPPKAGFEEVEA